MVSADPTRPPPFARTPWMSLPAPPVPARTRPAAGFRAPVVRAVGLGLGVAVSYALAGAVGLGLAAPGAPSVFWPAAGVALAAVVRFGWRAAPGLAAGMLAVRLARGHALPVVVALTAARAGGAL